MMSTKSGPADVFIGHLCCASRGLSGSGSLPSARSICDVRCWLWVAAIALLHSRRPRAAWSLLHSTCMKGMQGKDAHL